ncbi:MAG: hypothetical protein H6964_13440 [Chromatiaceae bacterium]|nr:hypothetical protein [Gammaproteobacteria bacterium]MCP5447979.1 hypothetical protein [Chromatiaceae bacterium]
MRTALLLISLFFWSVGVDAQERPQVWDYGVKECRSFLVAFDGWESGVESGIAEYLRYRGWLSGLVTGLSLATGMDVLQGVEPDGALRRIRIYCDERPDDDYFTAVMNLMKQLNPPEN